MPKPGDKDREPAVVPEGAKDVFSPDEMKRQILNDIASDIATNQKKLPFNTENAVSIFRLLEKYHATFREYYGCNLVITFSDQKKALAGQEAMFPESVPLLLESAPFDDTTFTALFYVEYHGLDVNTIPRYELIFEVIPTCDLPTQQNLTDSLKTRLAQFKHAVDQTKLGAVPLNWYEYPPTADNLALTLMIVLKEIMTHGVAGLDDEEKIVVRDALIELRNALEALQIATATRVSIQVSAALYNINKLMSQLN
ncbi:MAG: hypothetical protein WAU07_02055 [Microgenomates group bacterium]